EDVPGGREHDVLQHDVAGEEEIVVLDEARDREQRRADSDCDEREQPGTHDHRPRMPAGRNASVSSKNPNDTAGAHDGPEKVAGKRSTTPSRIAAITVPGRLPMPPITQMANTRPMYSRPTEGSTGWITMRNAPASEAVAIEMANAMRLIRIGSAAIRRSASWSCATAMMARPTKVRVR